MQQFLDRYAEHPSIVLHIPVFDEETGDIIRYKGLPILVTDESYRIRELMGEDRLYIKFVLPGYYNEPDGFPIGTYCDFQGQRYTLDALGIITKNGLRKYEYSLTMQADLYKMSKYILRNNLPGDTRLKFSYTARPEEFLRLLVENMNNRDEGWEIGDGYVEAYEKTVSFNHNTCLDALRMIAEAFGTEWEVKSGIDGNGKSVNTIYLRKAEYNKENPLPLAYGRGSGLLSGLGRSEFTDATPVQRLFVQGGERNIDADKYRKTEATGQTGSRVLLMPADAVIKFDGINFDDDITDPDSPNVREYVTDGSGASVMRKENAGTKNLLEGSLDCMEIYPMREGTVAGVIPVDPAKNFYDFTDNDDKIPDYNKYRIEGEAMTVIFQTGMLSGREFDVIYKHPGRFEIVPQEIDGITMPGGVYVPSATTVNHDGTVGDKYAVFHVMLPEEYILEAERNMLKEAVRYLYDNEMPKFTFTGTVDGIWAKRNWSNELNIGGRIILGGLIRFCDTQFLPEGMDIRIVRIKEDVNNPTRPQIELSNNTRIGSWMHNMKRQVESDEVTVETKDREVVQYTKRRFRNVKETMEMLRESMLNFSEGINPITVQTMQTVVGDESLQFEYSRPSYDFDFKPENEKKFYAPGGKLTHKTLGIDFISSEGADKDYLSWEMDEWWSWPLAEPEKRYRLYAKVEKKGTVSPERKFVLSETAIGMEDVAGYYHLLVGLLSSEYGGDREFAPLYGFTEILPGRITTDLIKSADGNNYMDLLNNAFKLTNGLGGLNEQTLSWEKGLLSATNMTVKNALKVAGEALIAGSKFTNEKIMSQRTYQGKPAFDIDGVNGTARFVQGMIEFAQAYAKLGQFMITDGRLTGYEDVNGQQVERIQMTTDLMGSLSSLSSRTWVIDEQYPAVEMTLDETNSDYYKEETYQAYFNAGETMLDSSRMEFFYTGKEVAISKNLVIKLGNTVIARETIGYNDYKYAVTTSGIYTFEYGLFVKGTYGEQEWTKGTAYFDVRLDKIVSAEKSIIARNGLASVWSTSKYLYVAANDPRYFIQAQGKMIFKNPDGRKGIETDEKGIKFNGIDNMNNGTGYIYKDANGFLKIG